MENQPERLINEAISVTSMDRAIVKLTRIVEPNNLYLHFARDGCWQISESALTSKVVKLELGSFIMSSHNRMTCMYIHIVIGPCWTNVCSQKLKRRILATFAFNRTALRATQPKNALSAAEVMSFGYHGAAIWTVGLLFVGCRQR